MIRALAALLVALASAACSTSITIGDRADDAAGMVDSRRFTD